MDKSNNGRVAEIFISCKKEVHYSRELILPQPALLRVISGEVRIATADREYKYYAGDTFLIPRNQLGRMSKLPHGGKPCLAISIVFRNEILKQYYAINPVSVNYQTPGPMLFNDHPLLESLYNSLMPYFKMADALPEDLATFKIEEAILILRSIDKNVDQLLAQFNEPGKIDLVDFMERNYMFNLPAEKFGYLTGRSLTTFKKDFKRAFNNTPEKWLTKKRLELAHFQIFERNKKPSDIYMEVGFQNLSHFSFAFKKQFGYNPSQAFAK